MRSAKRQIFSTQTVCHNCAYREPHLFIMLPHCSKTTMLIIAALGTLVALSHLATIPVLPCCEMARLGSSGCTLNCSTVLLCFILQFGLLLFALLCKAPLSSGSSLGGCGKFPHLVLVSLES